MAEEKKPYTPGIFKPEAKITAKTLANKLEAMYQPIKNSQPDTSRDTIDSLEDALFRLLRDYLGDTGKQPDEQPLVDRIDSYLADPLEVTIYQLAAAKFLKAHAELQSRYSEKIPNSYSDEEEEEEAPVQRYKH